MEQTNLFCELATVTIIGLMAFGISRGFGIRFRGLGIEMRIERQHEKRID